MAVHALVHAHIPCLGKSRTNTSKVTIWGESAGAYSVGAHLVAYGGRDDSLFRAGIMESGNPIN